MRKDGWPAMCIHGDKQQKERDWVLSEFKTGSTAILVATDVAARGLDVDDVKFVINYDYPNNSEDYVHRIGRTGRKDKTGTSYTLFTPQNAPKAKDLMHIQGDDRDHVLAQMHLENELMVYQYRQHMRIRETIIDQDNHLEGVTLGP